MFEALPIAFDSPYFNTSTPNWTYSTILTKNESHFDHVRHPYIPLKLHNATAGIQKKFFLSNPILNSFLEVSNGISPMKNGLIKMSLKEHLVF